MHRDLTIGNYVVAIRAERKCLESPDVVTGYTVRFAIRRIDGNFLTDKVFAERSDEIAPGDNYFVSVKSALHAGEQEARVRIGDIEARRALS